MKIVIVSGGTGSIALQQGLYYNLESWVDGLDIKVLVNAYDDGKSTGSVRKVLNGKILGPSDVRKNQVTRLALLNPSSPWIPFLNTRFTCDTIVAHTECLNALASLDKHHLAGMEIIKSAFDEYFSFPLSRKIDYTDFSIANIIYAGLAAQNAYSLRAAAKKMAEILEIPDNVILNSDEPLYLSAVTKSGILVSHEGDIVDWNDPSDPFASVFFSTSSGKMTDPVLCDEAKKALLEANLIILSTGTQWSSLIPTYASIGFLDSIRKSNAKIIMVMNRTPDKDSPSQTASDIINTLVPKYFPAGRLNVLLDSNADKQMRELTNETLDKICSVTVRNMSHPESKSVHGSHELASAIGEVYFKEYLNSSYYMFDYDDTLVGRGNSSPRASTFNAHRIIQLHMRTQVGICTGNSIKAISFPSSFTTQNAQPLEIFADGGVNRYEYHVRWSGKHGASVREVQNICPGALIPDSVIDKLLQDLCRVNIPWAKIENRNNAIIAIKPIDEEYRPIVASLINIILNSSSKYRNSDLHLNVIQNGRTTIEICNSNLLKSAAVEYVMSNKNIDSLTYIGDELDSGNDSSVNGLPKVKCLNVTSPAHTAFFISTLENILKIEENNDSV